MTALAPFHPLQIAAAIAAAAAVGVMTYALLRLAEERRTFARRRLAAVAAPVHRPLTRVAGVAHESLLVRVRTRIQTDLRLASLPWTSDDYIAVSLITAVVCGGGTFAVTRQWPFAVLAAVAGMAVQPVIVHGIASTRRGRFNAQVADTLELIAASLRAGFGFAQSLEIAAREQAEPMGGELRQVLREVDLGVSVEEGLTRLVARTGDEDLDLAVQAVLVLRRVGGDVGIVLGRIAETIRVRIRVRGELRTLTAQMKMSAWIVGLLPVGIGAVTGIMQPEQMSVLFTDPAGRLLVAGALVMELLGLLVVRRMADVRY